MRRIAALVLSMALLGLLTAAPASGAGVVSHTVSQHPQAVVDYWTSERMTSAVPLTAPSERVRASGRARRAIAPFPDQETSPGADTLYPQRVHGKLFFTRGTRNITCSATLVTANDRDAILTAAHCLFDPETGQAAINILFAPGFRNGVSPFGRFPASAVHYPNEWVGGDREFDIAAANLAPNAAGVPARALGTLGVTFNKPRSSYRGQTFQIFGYPGRPTGFYDGQRLILCVSPFTGFTASGVQADPCYQHEGSSGGAWVLPGGLVNSISSRHPPCAVESVGCTTVKIGTYFANVAFEIWAAAAGGVPRAVPKQLKRCKRWRKRAKRERCRNRVQTFPPVAG